MDVGVGVGEIVQEGEPFRAQGAEPVDGGRALAGPGDVGPLPRAAPPRVWSGVTLHHRSIYWSGYSRGGGIRWTGVPGKACSDVRSSPSIRRSFRILHG